MVDDPFRPDPRPRLGRGLAALIGDSKSNTSSTNPTVAARKMPIEFLCPNPRNPRKSFDVDELEELAGSIRHLGILQPILVRTIPTNSTQYEIVAGERRWRSAQKAGLIEVPVIVLDINERQATEIGLIENIQRTDLNALEEARGYELLIAEHGYTQNEVATIVGKSRSHVTNTMRLLTLPENSKYLLVSGALTPGHARALLAMTDPDDIANRIVRENLTVRDVERLARGRIRRNVKADIFSRLDNADAKGWEDKLGLELGTKVELRYFGDTGEIRITFHNLDQLEDIYLRLARSTGK